MNQTKSSPLARKLLTSILGVYLAVAVVLTFGQLYLEYNNEKDQLQQEVERVFQTFHPIFAQSIWSLNDAQINSNISGVMKNSNIVGIKLLDENKNLSKALGVVRNEEGNLLFFNDSSDTSNYQSYSSQFSQIYEATWPVQYTSKTRGKQTIAYLVLYSTSDSVMAEISDTFAATIISALVKTLCLWLISLMIIKRKISEPLFFITMGIEKLTPIMKDGPSDKEMIKSDKLSEEQDELARLLGTFTRMKVALIAKETEVLNYQKNLEEANRALEDKVKSRTQALEEANSKLHHLSITDALTGLRNRRYFDEYSNKEFKRAQRENQHISLIIGDIDHFKNFNDTYGHDIGDRVLTEVATAMSKQIHRDMDLLSRYGGEEFAILLPATDTQGAIKVAERIRKAIEEITFSAGDKQEQITISLGVATIHHLDVADLETIFKQADEALYQSKRSGRNCVTHYDAVDWDELSPKRHSN